MACSAPQPVGGGGDAPTAVRLPRVIFGSSALGNLFSVPSDEVKRSIVSAWLEHGGRPVAIDSAGKYGAGLALEQIGKQLRELGAPPERVMLSNKLGWRRVPLRGPEPTFEPGAWFGIDHDAEQCISREGILQCWEQGLELLGEPYRPQLVSVHDPDEFLHAARSDEDRARRTEDLFGAYDSLLDLKRQGEVASVGVGAKDWRVAKLIADRAPLDWVMIANSLTVYTHPAELLAWLGELADRGVAVVNSAVFNAGFLVGGKYFDYREPDPNDAQDQQLFVWRERFLRLCQTHGVLPAAACVQFGMSAPAVASVALNTSNPARVAECVRLAETKIPEQFWIEAKQAKLIDASFPFLPSNG